MNWLARRTRILWGFCFFLILGGCYESDSQMFNVDRAVLNLFPNKLVVSFGGQAAVVSRSEQNPLEYEAGRFKKIRVIPNGTRALAVQAYDTERQKFIYFGLSLPRDDRVRSQVPAKSVEQFVKSNRVVELRTFVLASTKQLTNQNRATAMEEMMGRANGLTEKVTIFNPELMTPEEIAAVVEQNVEQRAGARFMRAVTAVSLQNCNVFSSFINSGGSIGAVTRRHKVVNGACEYTTPFSYMRLRVNRVSPFECTGEAPGLQTCTFTFGVACMLHFTVANEPGLNRGICTGIEAMSQPVRATLFDDGSEIRFQSFELLRPSP